MPPALRLALIAVLGGLLAACSPTAAYNRLALARAGDVQVLRNEAYAPGRRQVLDAYVPQGGDGRLRPMLVFIHGGSWSDGDKSIYGFVGAAFARRGFVTVVPNYRLVPDVRFEGFLSDNAAAVAWARRNAGRLGGDPERLVLVGHSAGAYNAAMLALDPRWMKEAGLPPDTIKAWAGLAGPYDFLPLDDPATVAAFAQAEDLRATQPVNHVDRRDPPTFLATGLDDTRVEPRHTRELASRLQATGVPVDARYYPKVGHAGLVTALGPLFRGRAPVLDDLTRFLQGRVGPAQPPSP